MQFNTWVLTVTVVVLIYVAIAQGCSCQKNHLQTQFCNSQFVILGRVKREFTYGDTRVYKIRIRKDLKMNEKAKVALKSGRVLTSTWDSLCGVKLEIGKVYAIGGSIQSLKAHINLCGLIEPWDKLTKRQRKGLNRMYQQGCTCGIKRCRPPNCQKAKDFCSWSTFNFNDKLDCQRMQGICLRSASNRCAWARNKLQTACIRESHLPFLFGQDRKFVQ
ncbi:hypothetical protein FQA39_LY05821 [Lamprigera yunnana]|nr:hypothetical protein FQA39_LY05821 [Lamprigera yunnana]